MVLSCHSQKGIKTQSDVALATMDDFQGVSNMPLANDDDDNDGSTSIPTRDCVRMGGKKGKEDFRGKVSVGI